MAERLQKILAAAGISSRRKAEDLIREGRVSIDGRVASIGESADPRMAVIAIDGDPVERPKHRYLALNKPPGYVTTLAPTHGERSAIDLVHVSERVFTVGRLDKESSGLLLLTNDGEWGNLIMHPRYEIEKEYRVCVRGAVDAQALRALRAGTMIEGKMAVPVSVEPLERDEGTTWLKIILKEGRKREIRVLTRASGHAVVYLERVRIGHVPLGHLGVGRFRDLSRKEVERFRERGGVAEPGRSRQSGGPYNRDRRPRRSRKVNAGQGAGPVSRHPSTRHRPHVSRSYKEGTGSRGQSG